MSKIEAGSPRPLGATPGGGGVNFALFSSHATRVEVCLFDALSGAETARFELPGRSGDVWHGFVPQVHASAGTAYGFCVHGPHDAAAGLRFDAATVLLDPYARSLTHGATPRGRVLDGRFDWQNDRAPVHAWQDSLIYELHVKGFTQLNPAVPPEWRGKYLGLIVPAVIEHLKSIGVTAVELLPVQAFLSEAFLARRALVNYWGYNSLAWFAPANEYAVEDAVSEFKTMVKALHAAGIEVLLDVVFNHTAEGDELGPLLSMRGIDNPVYYRLMHGDARCYENLTGCGNTINCEHPEVRTLIIDCLRYWVEEMHVDGFRFDLGTVLAREAGGFNEQAPIFAALRADPVLGAVKLIAEPWDVGLGGYQLGRFPPGWGEWNDKYRDAVRSFWRGDPGKLGELAQRIAGSSDLFRHDGRKPTASINYPTSHDGFTLGDLVSYDERHNEANLEGNRDGHTPNYSWNCGVEGPSDDPHVIALRQRQMRNLLATLFCSQGVPMLLAGDEFARSQRGNNNAYCQDNEISWVDWRLRGVNQNLVEFVQLLARLRRRYPQLRRDTFLEGAARPGGLQDVTWLNASGTEMRDGDWQHAQRRAMAVWYGEQAGTSRRLLLLLNAAELPETFTLPAALEVPWIRLFDTSHDDLTTTGSGTAREYALGARSVALLEC